MKEEWKAIESTGGKIEVSNHGRMRSNLRTEGYILKYQTDNKGYLRCRVTINRKKMQFKAHREVAKAFIDNPEGKPQVNHIDCNKKNNHIDNLEWVTNKENCHHAIEHGLFDNFFAKARIENEGRRLSGSRKWKSSGGLIPCNELRRKALLATNITTGETIEFESIHQAEKTLNTRHINAVLNGTRSKAKGYTFSYTTGGGMGA